LLSTEALANVPFLILGNKIDIRTAASEPELRNHLGIHMTTGKEVTSVPKDSGQRPIELFMCSILKKQGYGEGFRWITHFLN
jgi:GTP-binding protein SAR1